MNQRFFAMLSVFAFILSLLAFGHSSRGIQGIQGVPGVNGKDGINGLPGNTGLPGKNGTNGENGLKGDKGDEGDKGDKGDIGPTGLTGAIGLEGKQGPIGIARSEVLVVSPQTLRSNINNVVNVTGYGFIYHYGQTVSIVMNYTTDNGAKKLQAGGAGIISSDGSIGSIQMFIPAGIDHLVFMVNATINNQLVATVPIYITN